LERGKKEGDLLSPMRTGKFCSFVVCVLYYRWQ